MALILLFIIRISRFSKIFPEFTSIILIDFIKIISCFTGSDNFGVGHKIAVVISTIISISTIESILNSLSIMFFIWSMSL